LCDSLKSSSNRTFTSYPGECRPLFAPGARRTGDTRQPHSSGVPVTIIVKERQLLPEAILLALAGEP